MLTQKATQQYLEYICTYSMIYYFAQDVLFYLEIVICTVRCFYTQRRGYNMSYKLFIGAEYWLEMFNMFNIGRKKGYKQSFKNIIKLFVTEIQLRVKKNKI